MFEPDGRRGLEYGYRCHLPYSGRSYGLFMKLGSVQIVLLAAVKKRGILARADGGERPSIRVDKEGAGNGPLGFG